MRRLVGLSLCAVLGLLTVMLSADEARAFGPFLRPHGHGHHRGAAVPVQPITPGQIITGIQVAQDVFDAIRDRRQAADADRTPAEPAISQDVFDSLDRNKTKLEEAVQGTNALTALVKANDKRYKAKFTEAIKHVEGGGGAKGSGKAPPTVGTKKAPGT